MENELNALKLKVQTLEGNSGNNQKMIMTMGMAAVAVLGWFFVSITTLQERVGSLHTVAIDVSEDLSSHKNHPNLHTNGINKLRDDVAERYATKNTVDTINQASGERHDAQQIHIDAVVEQLNARIDQLNKQIQEITEGYIEKANGKEISNLGHDQ